MSKTIGDRIKEKRIEKDMTLEALSLRVGVKRQTLSRYETGVITKVPSDKIEKIAEALNTTPAYLMGWEEAEAKADTLASITLAMFDDDELRSCVEAIVELKKRDPDSFNIISDLVEKLRKK